jgi:hypothetical protein
MAEEVMADDELVFPGLDAGFATADVGVVGDAAGFIPAAQVQAQQRASLR